MYADWKNIQMPLVFSPKTANFTFFIRKPADLLLTE